MNETVKYIIKWAVILVLGSMGLATVSVLAIMFLGNKLTIS